MQPTTQRRILVVDDEPGVVFAVRSFLETSGFGVVGAATFAEAVDVFRTDPPDAAVVDHHLPDADAVGRIAALRALDPDVPIVVLTGHGSIDLAVRAVKDGAEQFLTKPLDLQVLLVALERALENRRLRHSPRAADAGTGRAIDPFTGHSAAIHKLAVEAHRVLEAERPILVHGETGTGKGVLARWLHGASPRRDEPFVDLNCAGLSREFLESELFGHERGAFTGAVAAKPGLLEAAHRGTLFLDEIGDIDLALQPKVLKALEERRFRRLGEVRDRCVDVKLVAATHQDLARMVAEGRFRADLYYRINALPLRIPPLRERVDDIPAIARVIVEREAGALGRACTLSAEAMAALQSYGWPGNVRELRNVLERALLLTDGDALRAADLALGGSAAPPAAAASSGLTLAEVERLHVERVVREEGGRIPAAAARLGVPRSTLYAKMKHYGLKPPKAPREPRHPAGSAGSPRRGCDRDRECRADAELVGDGV